VETIPPIKLNLRGWKGGVGGEVGLGLSDDIEKGGERESPISVGKKGKKGGNGGQLICLVGGGGGLKEARGFRPTS